MDAKSETTSNKMEWDFPPFVRLLQPIDERSAPPPPPQNTPTQEGGGVVAVVPPPAIDDDAILLLQQGGEDDEDRLWLIDDIDEDQAYALIGEEPTTQQTMPTATDHHAHPPSAGTAMEVGKEADSAAPASLSPIEIDIPEQRQEDIGPFTFTTIKGKNF